LVGGGAVLAWMVSPMTERLEAQARGVLQAAGKGAGSPAAMTTALWEAWMTLAMLIVPVGLGALAGALLVGVVQTGGNFSWRALSRRPRALLGVPTGWLALVGLAWVLASHVRPIIRALGSVREASAWAPALEPIVRSIAARTVVVFVVAGLIDWWRARAAWRRRNFLSREEARLAASETGSPAMRAEVGARRS
jgi:hypothetical protein